MCIKIKIGIYDLYEPTFVTQYLSLSLLILNITETFSSPPLSKIITWELYLVNPCGYGIGSQTFTCSENSPITTLIKLSSYKNLN